MESMRQQAERFGARILLDDAIRVDLEGPIRVIETGAGEAFHARAVILAMGSAYRKLGLADEERLTGRGVSWCATCDGFFFREQEILVVGGGDSAMEEAPVPHPLRLKVTIVHRRDEFRASKIMAQRVLDHPKIEVAWNSESHASTAPRSSSPSRFATTVTGAERDLPATGLFVAIGHDPRSELVTGTVDTDAAGFVLVDHPSTRTNLSGVFAAGDLVDHTYRQAITRRRHRLRRSAGRPALPRRLRERDRASGRLTETEEVFA